MRPRLVLVVCNCEMWRRRKNRRRTYSMPKTTLKTEIHRVNLSLYMYVNFREHFETSEHIINNLFIYFSLYKSPSKFLLKKENGSAPSSFAISGHCWKHHPPGPVLPHRRLFVARFGDRARKGKRSRTEERGEGGSAE